MPPMDGLQDIMPSVSMLWVSNKRGAARARTGQGGLRSGMTAANHDDIEFFRDPFAHCDQPRKMRTRIIPQKLFATKLCTA